MSAYALIHCQWSNLVGRRNYSSLKINYRSKEKQKMLVGCLWRQQLRVKKHEPREVTAQEQRVWVRCLFSLSFLQRRLIKAENPQGNNLTEPYTILDLQTPEIGVFYVVYPSFFFIISRLKKCEVFPDWLFHNFEATKYVTRHFWTDLLILRLWNWERAGRVGHVTSLTPHLDRLQLRNKLSNLLCRTYR